MLAGGGLKVAFQAGVLQVWLDEAGLRFDHVDGASGGTFNLAMICQGLSGTEIADNWRRMSPLDGASFHVGQWGRLAYAESLLTMDRYRRNVFPGWGLDWDAIRASRVPATFNVYNFTKQDLEVLPPARMSEDYLAACVALPMWFPPVHVDGDTYIDAVYVTDANIEEAIDRGSDEIWVVWTVSESGTWRPGFVATYFQIIEATANGHYKRMTARIERNNEAIARGDTGEFGRHIELKILRAEVPVHYLLDIGADRLHEAVNRGVRAARSWCVEHGVKLSDPIPQLQLGQPVSLRFGERMGGRVRTASTVDDVGLAVRLTIAVDNVERFVTDPEHAAKVTGQVDSLLIGGARQVIDGTFNLFVDDGDLTRKQMRYRLHVIDESDKPLTLVGVKTVDSGDPRFVWRDTTTLHTRLLRGHLAPVDDEDAEAVATGVLRLSVPAFLRELTTFRLSGASPAARARAMAQFGTLFLGNLWDVYAQPIQFPGPF
jgi:predicted acylesterase/phospholipase RssA